MLLSCDWLKSHLTNIFSAIVVNGQSPGPVLTAMKVVVYLCGCPYQKDLLQEGRTHSSECHEFVSGRVDEQEHDCGQYLLLFWDGADFAPALAWNQAIWIGPDGWNGFGDTVPYRVRAVVRV